MGKKKGGGTPMIDPLLMLKMADQAATALDPSVVLSAFDVGTATSLGKLLKMFATRVIEAFAIADPLSTAGGGGGAGSDLIPGSRAALSPVDKARGFKIKWEADVATHDMEHQYELRGLGELVLYATQRLEQIKANAVAAAATRNNEKDANRRRQSSSLGRAGGNSSSNFSSTGRGVATSPPHQQLDPKATEAARRKVVKALDDINDNLRQLLDDREIEQRKIQHQHANAEEQQDAAAVAAVFRSQRERRRFVRARDGMKAIVKSKQADKMAIDGIGEPIEASEGKFTTLEEMDRAASAAANQHHQQQQMQQQQGSNWVSPPGRKRQGEQNDLLCPALPSCQLVTAHSMSSLHRQTIAIDFPLPPYTTPSQVLTKLPATAPFLAPPRTAAVSASRQQQPQHRVMPPHPPLLHDQDAKMTCAKGEMRQATVDDMNMMAQTARLPGQYAKRLSKLEAAKRLADIAKRDKEEETRSLLGLKKPLVDFSVRDFSEYGQFLTHLKEDITGNSGLTVMERVTNARWKTLEEKNRRITHGETGHEAPLVSEILVED